MLAAEMSRPFSADVFDLNKSWALPQVEVNARLWRFVSGTRRIKEALQKELFPAEPKQWNADCNSGNRHRDWIVAEQNYERSATGGKIRFYQNLA